MTHPTHTHTHVKSYGCPCKSKYRYKRRWIRERYAYINPCKTYKYTCKFHVAYNNPCKKYTYFHVKIASWFDTCYGVYRFTWECVFLEGGYIHAFYMGICILIWCLYAPRGGLFVCDTKALSKHRAAETIFQGYTRDTMQRVCVI